MRNVTSKSMEHPAQPSVEFLLLQVIQLLQSQQQQSAAVVAPETRQPISRPERNTLTVDEAWDEFFERKISKFKLYDMLRKGEIPSGKIGSKYLLRRDVLERWMQDQEAARA